LLKKALFGKKKMKIVKKILRVFETHLHIYWGKSDGEYLSQFWKRTRFDIFHSSLTFFITGFVLWILILPFRNLPWYFIGYFALAGLTFKEIIKTIKKRGE